MAQRGIRPWCLFGVIAALFACSPASAQKSQLPPPAGIQVDFNRDVKPILQANCYSCHGASKQESGLRLDVMRTALVGGDSGRVIMVGNSAQSKLILRLAGSDWGLQMPPTAPLSAEEIGVLRAWIDQGLNWPDTPVEESLPPEKTGPPDPKGEPLFEAIRKGDLPAVRTMLGQNRSLVNARGFGGARPLMHAVLYAGEDCMRVLLEQGGDPNARNAAGATALMWAAGDLGKVRLLLARGAQANVKSEDGRTPLMIASRQEGAAAVVKLLLEKGAEINARDVQGSTALMRAATARDVETLKVLMANGADVNARAGSGATALMAAARSGCLSCVELLVARGADVKAATKRGSTALSAVASLGAADLIRALLQKGADANTKDDQGYTPLMLAAYSEFLAIDTAKALLEKGADVNARNANGETALSLARKRGDTAVVRLLLKAGARE